MTTSVPYHKWLLGAIRQASFVGIHELAPMAKEVRIPVGFHDGIIEAWRRKVSRLGMKDDLSVPAALLKQKDEVEAEAQKESAAKVAKGMF